MAMELSSSSSSFLVAESFRATASRPQSAQLHLTSRPPSAKSSRPPSSSGYIRPQSSHHHSSIEKTLPKSLLTVNERAALDHHYNLSYFRPDHSSYELAGSLVCLNRLLIMPSTTESKEVTFKKMGKMITKIKKVIIPARDLIEMTLTDGTTSWHTTIEYEIHNVARRRGTKDESWPLDAFFFAIGDLLKNPGNYPTVQYIISQADNNLTLELRELRDGITLHYIKTATLVRVENDQHSITQGLAKTLTMERFINYARVGRLDSLSELYTRCKQYIAVDNPLHASEMNALQIAAYNGRTKVVEWLMTEAGAYPMSYSTDGYTALHRASMRGHLEIAKLLIENGASILDETHNTEHQTALALMVANGHRHMVVEFVGELSQHAFESILAQGTRKTEWVGMFNLMKNPWDIPKNGRHKIFSTDESVDEGSMSLDGFEAENDLDGIHYLSSTDDSLRSGSITDMLSIDSTAK